MAYALRYYKEIAQTDGGVVRLEIHKKDSTTSAVEIGAVVQGLSLEIQGQQDDIDTPIQKTSLHMTFVDASDIENGQKNGFWEEFYTPDALLWRVILKAKDAGKTSFRTIWGGYVTPDSFSEDLVYRGSVSITARDNIGHMQDFPFDALGDADGLISLYNLVSMGWEKIQSPMDLYWNGLDWLSCNDVIAYHTLMNVSQFKDMNWYKAIETALASYGAVMRYAGENEVYVTTLRHMPSLGRNINLMDRIEPTFIAGAQRELVPAVKRIEENVEYELESAPQPLVKASDFSGNSHVLDSANELYGYSLTNTQEGEGWFNSKDYAAIYFSPSRYIIEDAENEDVESKMYVVAGVGYNNRAEYSRTILAQDITINITFGTGLMRKRFTDASGRPSGGYYLVPRLGTIFGISYAVYVIQNGVKQYYNFAKGEWEAQATYRREENDGGITEINIPVGLSDYNGNVILGFDFGGIDATIPYINIASVTFSGANELREKNIVNTIYNADNNVILTRDPQIGSAFDKVALPAFIKNGIFYRSGYEILPARLWSWGGSEQQMAVWNHLQLLCYYAKPNNLISGTIVNADITRVAAIYEWNHAEHILVSGRYNFLNGHIEGAVLREFARYEDMWSEVAGAAMPETEQDSRSNVEGGASSSASPSTYTATQNVNIGTGGGGGTGASQLNDLTDVDTTGVVAQSVLYYNGTSWVDMSFASLVNPLLNPYLKSVDAETTYATKTALSGVETALSANISANTNAIAGLGTRMTTAENEIALRYTKQETNNLLGKYLLLESANQTIKGNITIEGNLIVTGDTASGARGTDSGTDGTLIGVIVNGTRYEDETNGMLDLSTLMNQYALATEIPSLDGYAKLTDIPATMAWTAITGKPSFASVATSGSYNDLSNKPTIPTKTSQIAEETNLYFTNARAVSALADTLKDYVTKTALASDLGEYASKEWVNEKGYITGITLTGDDYISVNGYKLSLAIDAQGGLTNTGQGLGIYQIPSAKIVTDALGYTPLSTAGGTITGDLTLVRNPSVMAFKRNSSTLLGYLGFNSSGEPIMYASDGATVYKFYHTGNFNPADYLPLSGGTITISTYRGMVLKHSATSSYPLLWFANGSGNIGAIGIDTNKNVVLDNGTTAYTLIHSGNIDDYAILYKDGISVNDDYNVIGYGGTAEGWPVAGPAMIWGSWAGYRAMLHARNGVLRFNSMENKVLTGWKTIAFTDSDITGNAAGLKHSNGTISAILNSSGNVTIGASDLAGTSAKLYVDGKAIANGNVDVRANSNGNAGVGLYMNNTSAEGYLFSARGSESAKSLRLYYMPSSNDTFKQLVDFTPSGNVLIGTTTDSGYKLDVYGGDIRSHISEALPRNIIVSNSNGAMGIRVAAAGNRGLYDATNSKWMVYTNGTNVIIPDNAGNVLIGTTTDDESGAKLQVDGGCITIKNGTAKTYSYIRSGNYSSNTSRLTIGTCYGYSTEKIGISVYNGCVGIGETVTSGAYTLDVDGTARCGKNEDGADLLVFKMGREWRFQQSGTGGSTALVLRTLELGKHFHLRNNANETAFTYVAQNGANRLYAYCPTGIESTLYVTGAVTMSSTLSVGGLLTANGNAVIKGDTSTGSDIRFKDKLSDHRIALSDIANAPLFTFKWNDREDDSVHLGSSAQYWEKVAPWLVKGEDFKTLDYSTLGVAIGISLANKAVNHEERIKILEDKVKALEAENRRLRYA